LLVEWQRMFLAVRRRDIPGSRDGAMMRYEESPFTLLLRAPN